MKTAVQIGRLVLLLSAAMLAITTAAGCADASARSTDETPAVIKPQEITINSKNYFFVAPDTIEAGLTTIHLRNAGPALHHAQIIRLPQGQTVDGLLNEIKQKGEAALAQVGLFGGPNAATPGGESTITVDLQPGNYALFCFIPTAEGVPHLMKGMTRAITVVPSTRAAATAPSADASLALSDYKFDFSTELKSGERTIKVENKATQSHEVLIVKLNDGTTAEQFLKALQTMGPNLPGVAYGGTVGLQPGAINYVTTRFAPGKYALYCFVPDARDGKPHVAHGMIREFTVN